MRRSIRGLPALLLALDPLSAGFTAAIRAATLKVQAVLRATRLSRGQANVAHGVGIVLSALSVPQMSLRAPARYQPRGRSGSVALTWPVMLQATRANDLSDEADPESGCGEGAQAPALSA